jgi:hypothetical protein
VKAIVSSSKVKDNRSIRLLSGKIEKKEARRREDCRSIMKNASILLLLLWGAFPQNFMPTNVLVMARPSGGMGWFGRSPNLSQRKNHKNLASLFTVDPSAILSTLAKAGGVFIPKSSQKDIEILRDCLHCERAEINVIEKTMILYNFTIGLKGEPAALRVGRTYVHFDSYIAPTIYVEVDDVDLLVEFHNMILTKSNWQDLKGRGFPPEIAVTMTGSNEDRRNSKKPSKDEAPATDFVRIGSVDLSGSAGVRLVSRTLDKEIGHFEVDMDAFDDFTAVMMEASEKNFQDTGRRGLPSTELATLLQTYFTKKIRSFLLDRVDDVKIDPKELLQGAGDSVQTVMETAGRSVRGYAADASRKTGNELQNVLTARLDKLGVSRDQIDKARDSLQYFNASAVREALARRQQSNVANDAVDNMERNDEPWFPDY